MLFHIRALESFDKKLELQLQGHLEDWLKDHIADFKRDRAIKVSSCLKINMNKIHTTDTLAH